MVVVLWVLALACQRFYKPVSLSHEVRNSSRSDWQGIEGGVQDGRVSNKTHQTHYRWPFLEWRGYPRKHCNRLSCNLCVDILAHPVSDKNGTWNLRVVLIMIFILLWQQLEPCVFVLKIAITFSSGETSFWPGCMFFFFSNLDDLAFWVLLISNRIRIQFC